jgi:hypothetical protein
MPGAIGVASLVENGARCLEANGKPYWPQNVCKFGSPESFVTNLRWSTIKGEAERSYSLKGIIRMLRLEADGGRDNGRRSVLQELALH